MGNPFRRYDHRLLFAGRLPVAGILLIGLSAYVHFVAPRYDALVQNAMTGILTSAKLENEIFRVVDWVEKGGCLRVYLAKQS